MRRIIQLFDSTGQMWVNLSLVNNLTQKDGSSGTWEALEPGILDFSSGPFSSRPWGLDLVSDNGRGGFTLVARLLKFWKVAGLYCNGQGPAQITQGRQLENDDEASWKQWS